MKVSLEDIQAAQKRISSRIQKTSIDESRFFSKLLETQVFLKMENQQNTGSFKIRGALNKFSTLTKNEKSKGIIASSAGNHAQGVALAASLENIRARIVMPETAPIVKRLATEGYGAEVILHGAIYDDAFHHAQDLAKKTGESFVHPFQDPAIIAGQGTLGLEIFEEIPDIDSIVLPIGGGGLISGVAVALKQLKPSCRIYGVVSDRAEGMKRLYQGQSLEGYHASPTIADGIGVKNPSSVMHENFVKNFVDDIISVSDEEIAQSIVYLLERAKTLVEGSGAASVAAAIKAKHWDLGKKTCIVLSGGNIDLNIISKVIERGQSKAGRLNRVRLEVRDQPGALQKVTDLIAQEGANILDVKHDRLQPQLDMNSTAMEILLETRGLDHLARLTHTLKAHGIKVDDP